MVRFGHVSVTLSNACEIKKLCRRLYTYSVQSQLIKALIIEGPISVK